VSIIGRYTIYRGIKGEKHENKETNFNKKVAAMLCIVAAIIALPLAGCGSNDTTPETFTVTFNANGGSPTPEPQTIEKGKTATEPTGDKAPIKTNYTLDGWYKEIGLSTKWNFATDTVTANIDLYAKWNETQKTKPEDTPRDLSFGTNLKVTIKSDEQFTTAEWNTLCDDVVAAIMRGYNSDYMPDTNKIVFELEFEGNEFLAPISITLLKSATYDCEVTPGDRIIYLNTSTLNMIDLQPAVWAIANGEEYHYP